MLVDGPRFSCSGEHWEQSKTSLNSDSYVRKLKSLNDLRALKLK
jgi:hypothetical protein